MKGTTIGMFGDISCFIVDDSLDECSKLSIYRQKITIVSKLNCFHEHWDGSWAQGQT